MSSAQGNNAHYVRQAGTDNNVFDFNALAETGITSTTRDVITDFVRGQDRIDLSTIDTNMVTAITTADESFTACIASTTAFAIAGQLKMVGDILYGNTDADSAAEFTIELSGVSSLTTSDFVL